ncbi:Nramp family divalent metal transporter [Chromohalobacter canadensis]|uniref:Nramp family divalent metal transporter n=1 Tax=Chromohalobacter canadensis TaxID=141389 RepID=UPI0021C1632D|nr:Nramp family divalent metal transporter [Chromohalobacter canadensis]MCT8467341.1 Nramp family divalent metal transporter [Chromohalobacter canadensis]MCT8470911.1 Nramp family divalent metal transporter [Chromohalobacter canadensis]MCT8497838.1 Nramp family divalent metal transporter [Chromohalobacter canadensis]
MLSTISDSAIREQAASTLNGKARRWGWTAFFGPALIAAVAYIDPGNFATNIEAGSRYGYTLLWVVLVANLMAMLIQTLSARLGLATGRNLPQVIRARYPRPVVWCYWIQAEVVAIATDLAEFLGASLAFNLLFGLSLMEGALLTGAITYLALHLYHYGFRLMEIVIGAMILAVASGFILELVISRPEPTPLLEGLLIPSFPDGYSLYLAAGILGATVMPHVIYLHSALSQQRIQVKDDAHRIRLMRYYRLDVIIGMAIAGVVNLSMLAMAAAAFHANGRLDVATISDSYKLLAPMLGQVTASHVFGAALLIAGLSSSIVGTLSGQVIMQGFMAFTIPLWLRRLVTMLPALVIIMLGVSEQKALVASQVILSFGIPFALIPLLFFTANRRIMGNLVNHRSVTVVGGIVCTLIVALNAYVLFSTFTGH